MIQIDENGIKKFANEIIDNYKKLSVLKEISNITNSSIENDKDFYQIGERVKIPKEFFKVGGNTYKGVLVGDFAKDITNGEIMFIIDYLINQAKNARIQTYKIDMLSYDKIISCFVPTNAPTDIFVPIEHTYYEAITDLILKGFAERDENGIYILYCGKKIKVHWFSKNSPYNNILVFLNKNSFKVIQKKAEDMKPISGSAPPIYSCGKGEVLEIIFSELETDNFELNLRVVIKPIINNKEFIGIIELPKKITN